MQSCVQIQSLEEHKERKRSWGEQCKHTVITLSFNTEQISQPASEAEREENNT